MQGRELPQQPVLQLLAPPLPPKPSETLQHQHSSQQQHRTRQQGSATPSPGSQARGDLQWQYLEHLVHGRAADDAALHTQLAEALLDAILPLLPMQPPSSASQPEAKASSQPQQSAPSPDVAGVLHYRSAR